MSKRQIGIGSFILLAELAIRLLHVSAASKLIAGVLAPFAILFLAAKLFPTGDPAEQPKLRPVPIDTIRRQRSIAIALALFGLVVLFFVATIVRLGGNVAHV